MPLLYPVASFEGNLYEGRVERVKNNAAGISIGIREGVVPRTSITRYLRNLVSPYKLVGTSEIFHWPTGP